MGHNCAMKTLIASMAITLSLSLGTLGPVQGGGSAGDVSTQSFCNVTPWLPFFCKK